MDNNSIIIQIPVELEYIRLLSVAAGVKASDEAYERIKGKTFVIDKDTPNLELDEGDLRQLKLALAGIAASALFKEEDLSKL